MLTPEIQSFTYNLAFLLAQANGGQLPVIVFNDAYEGSIERLVASLPQPFDCIVISPGPGRLVTLDI